MEMTLLQALDYIASQPASDELQAVVDAIDRARTNLARIKDHAESILKYGKVGSCDQLLVEFIRDGAVEALS